MREDTDIQDTERASDEAKKPRENEERIVELHQSLYYFLDISEAYRISSRLLMESDGSFESVIGQLVTKSPNLYAFLTETIV